MIDVPMDVKVSAGYAQVMENLESHAILWFATSLF